MAAAPQTLRLPQADDFHVHLRQGKLMGLVAPMVESGGAGLAYVMPNLKPPIANAAEATAYAAQLRSLCPHTTFLTTLYLTPTTTPADIAAAAEAGVVGVKSYPRGVTTNSEGGIESYEAYYEVFGEMEKRGMVLNLHGEVPSDYDKGITVLNAEEAFLSHLVKLHNAFPRLKIVLEHATTAAAVRTVKSLGDTVGCTITVHHLALVVDDWASNSHNYCKPVAKTPEDRAALRDIVKEGHPRFFMGTDSAPHPVHTKESAHAHAGVFTSPYLMPYLAHILESFGALDKLRGFACEYGRKFYGIDAPRKDVVLVRKPLVVPEICQYVDDEGRESGVVPFMAGQTLNWSLE